jgi:hypothetical protein
MNAVMELLSQIGVSADGSTSSATSSATSTTSSAAASASTATSSTSGSQASGTSSDADIQQALQAFMHSLFAALHAQKGSGAGQSTDSCAGGSGGSDATSVSATAAATTTSSSTGSTSTGSSSTDSTLSNLEQSFQNLVSAVGGTDGSTTALNNFLSALASKMDGASSVGNLVSTQA